MKGKIDYLIGTIISNEIYVCVRACVCVYGQVQFQFREIKLKKRSLY